jgi:hypothetical protein
VRRRGPEAAAAVLTSDAKKRSVPTEISLAVDSQLVALFSDVVSFLRDFLDLFVFDSIPWY